VCERRDHCSAESGEGRDRGGEGGACRLLMTGLAGTEEDSPEGGPSFDVRVRLAGLGE
jgi:hypothetical protein